MWLPSFFPIYWIISSPVNNNPPTFAGRCSLSELTAPKGLGIFSRRLAGWRISGVFPSFSRVSWWKVALKGPAPALPTGQAWHGLSHCHWVLAWGQGLGVPHPLGNLCPGKSEVMAGWWGGLLGVCQERGVRGENQWSTKMNVYVEEGGGGENLKHYLTKKKKKQKPTTQSLTYMKFNLIYFYTSSCQFKEQKQSSHLCLIS